MLEHIPAHDHPTHLAWYNIVLNASVLVGSLGGPLIVDLIGLVSALMSFALLRLLAGIYILRGDNGLKEQNLSLAFMS